MNVRLNPRNLCKGQAAAAAERPLRNGYEGTSRRIASLRGWEEWKGLRIEGDEFQFDCQKEDNVVGHVPAISAKQKIYIPTYPFLFVC